MAARCLNRRHRDMVVLRLHCAPLHFHRHSRLGGGHGGHPGGAVPRILDPLFAVLLADRLDPTRKGAGGL